MPPFFKCLLISFFLLCFVKENAHLFPRNYSSTPKLLKNWKDQFLEKHNKSQAARFALAAVVGIKNHLPRKLRKKLKDYNLLHICTPSGLHLSALFSFLFVLIRRSRKSVKIGIFLLCLCLPGFYSLKRIALLGLSTVFYKNVPFEQKFKWVMLLDLLFGTFQFSPLSWIYSYTYLSLFILTPPHLLTRLYYYFGTLIMFALFNSNSVSILALPLNFIYSALFTLIYPILFLDTLIGELWLSPLYEFYLNSLPTLPSLFSLTATLNLLFAYILRTPKVLICLLILTSSEGLGPVPFSLTQPRRFYSLPRDYFVVSYQTYGLKIESEDRRCKMILNGHGMKIRCREIKSKK